MKSLALLCALPALAIPSISGAHSLAEPTCAELLDIDVHGQHVVRDYVIGDRATDSDWPPSGVGEAIGGSGGAAVPGGPGPGFHFLYDVPPGASFCVDAQSWHAVD